MSIAQQVFTDAGKSMLGRAQHAETLHISKIVVGSGGAGQESDLYALTQLIQWRLDATIATQRDYGDGTLLVEGSFKSSDATVAFDLREIGVMAHIGSEADRLYSVANCFQDPPDHVDPAAPEVFAFKIKLIIDRIPSNQVVIQIGPTEAVLGENVGSDTVGPGIYKEAVANLLRFKRLEAGTGVTLTDFPDKVNIGVTAFTQLLDIDLYVPTDNPDIPAGHPELGFPTIQAAHDHLLQYVIPTNHVARIHVYSGHFIQNTPIAISHPNATQIQILGKDMINRAVTGNVTTTGALPNIDVTVTVSGGTAGIAVNDVVYLQDAPHWQLEGCGYVTQVTSSTVKIRMRIQNTLPPGSVGALSSTKILILPTQMTSNQSGYGNIFSCPNGIGLIQNFGLRSTQAQQGVGMSLKIQSEIENILCVNFNIGIGVDDSARATAVIAANACNVGLQVGANGTLIVNPPAQNFRNKVTFSGNLVYGIWCVSGSYIAGSGGTMTYCNSNSTGIRSDAGGFVGVSNTASTGGIVAGANVEGAHAELLGMILTSNSVHSAINSNTTWDLRAATGGQISIVWNAITNGLYSPALGVLGGSGGYIDIGNA
jgi:hypothetical protein